jgi:hypothetical protein
MTGADVASLNWPLLPVDCDVHNGDDSKQVRLREEHPAAQFGLIPSCQMLAAVRRKIDVSGFVADEARGPRPFGAHPLQ